MKTSDFYYELPPELIAQTPLEPRDSSRLMVLDRTSGEIIHRHFRDIGAYLHPGDLLVLNNSRVLPARLFGRREDTGGDVELLLLEQKSQDSWETLVKPGKRAREGARIVFGDGLLTGEIAAVQEDGNRIIRFELREDEAFFPLLDQLGQMPLPPYITAELADQERYQTVYSKTVGSAAAPTAGLHFTPQLLDALRAGGVETAEVTLHVGLGTFRPVKAEEIADHHMHSEHYWIPAETAERINAAKARGSRVIAVGTTSCRTLESAAAQGELRACSGSTDIFIYPGYQFRCIDGLITNFHLPESTLIMLTAAFCGRENILHAYKTGVREGYRFFSFGDAMFIGDLT